MQKAGSDPGLFVYGLFAAMVGEGRPSTTGNLRNRRPSYAGLTRVSKNAASLWVWMAGSSPAMTRFVIAPSSNSPLLQQIHPEHLIEAKLPIFLVAKRLERALHAIRVSFELRSAARVAVDLVVLPLIERCEHAA